MTTIRDTEVRNAGDGVKQIQNYNGLCIIQLAKGCGNRDNRAMVLVDVDVAEQPVQKNPAMHGVLSLPQMLRQRKNNQTNLFSVIIAESQVHRHLKQQQQQRLRLNRVEMIHTANIYNRECGSGFLNWEDCDKRNNIKNVKITVQFQLNL